MGTLPKRLEDLEVATVADLRAWWQGVFGHPAPPRLRRGFLELGLAYEIQRRDHGGLDRQTREVLATAMNELRSSGEVLPKTVHDLRPGTRLVREWGGRRHVVTAAQSGFEYNGKSFNSLSSIAAQITGVKRSGPLFFGLKGRS